jgi:hypothetical protein
MLVCVRCLGREREGNAQIVRTAVKKSPDIIQPSIFPRAGRDLRNGKHTPELALLVDRLRTQCVARGCVFRRRCLRRRRRPCISSCSCVVSGSTLPSGTSAGCLSKGTSAGCRSSTGAGVCRSAPYGPIARMYEPAVCWGRRGERESLDSRGTSWSGRTIGDGGDRGRWRKPRKGIFGVLLLDGAGESE